MKRVNSSGRSACAFTVMVWMCPAEVGPVTLELMLVDIMYPVVILALKYAVDACAPVAPPLPARPRARAPASAAASAAADNFVFTAYIIPTSMARPTAIMTPTIITLESRTAMPPLRALLWLDIDIQNLRIARLPLR